MSIYAAPSATFEATIGPTTTGLTGTIGVRIMDGQGNTTTARSTASIIETPSGSGIYVATRTAPSVAGQYIVVWDDGATPATFSPEELEVTSTTTATVSGSMTYDPTTTLGKVRLEIGDTDATDVLFTDQEINVYLTRRADSILLSAADLCDVLAVRFARRFDFETDQQKFMRSQMSKQYAALAKELRQRSAGTSSVAATKVDAYSQDVTANDVAAVNPRVGRVFVGYYDPDVPV